MTMDDAIKWAKLLAESDDHIVADNMLDAINDAFPEFVFYMTVTEQGYMVYPWINVRLASAPKAKDEYSK